MASLLRLSVESIFFPPRSSHSIDQTYHTAIVCQCRPFSRAAQRSARAGGVKYVPVKSPAQPSQKLRVAKEMANYAGDLPNDMGLLPGTFIKPLWRDMPSIFDQPRLRLRYEWLWIKSAFQNFLSVVAYSKWINKGLPLRLKERRRVARELHQRMYSAFAAGDTATLRRICCNGLAANLNSRISSRPKNDQVEWALEKYLRTPGTFLTGVRVVSDRAVQIPALPDSGIRQVVVRITSRQSRGKITTSNSPDAKEAAPPTGSEAPAAAVPTKRQDCTEYIVIQKLMWNKREEDWRIWGHATPTTIEDLESPFFAPGLGLADRIDAMREMMEGRK